MNHLLTTCVASLLFVSLFAIGINPAAAEDDLLEPGVPGALGIQLKTNNFTPEIIERVHRMGFRTVRRGFYWDGVEPVKGQYDFSGWDPAMDKAKELGVTVVGVFFGGNKVYEDNGRGGIQTPEGRQGFANFAAALAKHYRDHPVMWEIWNEPNVRTFWRKDGKHNSEPFAQEYTDLVKAVMPAVLAVDPDAYVMAGSVSNYWEPSYEWTAFCFKKGILDTGIKAWSVHPYGVRTPEEFAVGHTRTRELLREHGHPDMPMLNTERGFSVKKRAEGWSGGSKDRALEFQGWHFVRQLMADQIAGVPLSLWYQWDGDKFGLVVEGEPERPVYTAATVMFDQLGGYTFDRRLETNNPLDYLVVWKNQEGDRRIVAWTAPQPGGTPDEARPHQTTVRTNSDARYTVIDINGGRSSIDGGLTLALTGAPQYVHVPAGVVLGVATAEQAPPPVVEQPALDTTRGVSLELFEAGTEWAFKRNNSDGSFELTKGDDGTPMGVLKYDFSDDAPRRPYVLATTAVDISHNATTLVLHARSRIAQQLTFRLIDSTGQTHQVRKRLKGTGQWEAMELSLTQRMEHWGGAKDGRIHFPIKTLIMSVPKPKAGEPTGTVDYSRAVVFNDGPGA